MRAGESMEHILREWIPNAIIAKILIQRDEKTAQPRFFYEKLPENIADCSVLLLVRKIQCWNDKNWPSSSAIVAVGSHARNRRIGLCSHPTAPR